jgi:hypothetical protein
MLTTTLGLAGCAPVKEALSIPVCTPETPMENVYKAAPRPWANMIFDYAFPPAPASEATPPPTAIPPTEQQITAAHFAAFNKLIEETQRWSDVKTVRLDDTSVVNLVVTYLSPELLQAVFLNQALKDRSPTSDFPARLEKAFKPIVRREELLFLVTASAVNYNPTPAHHTIKLPIQEMVLHNAENLTIVHNHDDHNLEQAIDTLADPVFGYLGYPLSQVTANQCHWVLDPAYNTVIVITVPFLEVDGVKKETPQFWTIPYVPLMGSESQAEIPNFNMPAGYDVTLMTPQPALPRDINQANYWQELARFIWRQVTKGNY